MYMPLACCCGRCTQVCLLDHSHFFVTLLCCAVVLKLHRCGSCPFTQFCDVSLVSCCGKCIQVCFWGHSHTCVMCLWCAVVGDVYRCALGLFAKVSSGSSLHCIAGVLCITIKHTELCICMQLASCVCRQHELRCNDLQECVAASSLL